MKNIRMGDIYWVNFDGLNHNQSGIRPAIVVQNNVGNKYSPTLAVVPLTSSTSKAKMPTHVTIHRGMFGLSRDSIALCECQRAVDKVQLGEYIGTVDASIMKRVVKSCLINTPLLPFLSVKEMCELRKDTISYVS